MDPIENRKARQNYESFKREESASPPAPCSALVMTFKVEADGKTVEGKMNVPDDDGTTHMPMMVWGLMKQLAESVPAILGARSMTITASFDAPNSVLSELSSHNDSPK